MTPAGFGDGDGMEANGSRVRRTGGAEDHGSGGYCVRWRGTEGGGDERTMLLLVSVTRVVDGVERRWSPVRPVRRGTAGEGGVHRRSKTRGRGSMDLKIMVVADW